MSKIFLIHGYGIGRTAPILYTALHEDAGFSIFNDLIRKKSADVFYWDIEKKFSIFQLINPLVSLMLYKDERNTASSTQLLERLHQALKESTPETIVCHSMGCFLFLNYLSKHPLPETVRKLLFVQGDVSLELLHKHPPFKKLLRNKSVTLINIYCPWDFTLWWSHIINRYSPIGLHKIPEPAVKNVLIPVSLFDTHTYTIRQNKKILSLINSQ
ncbi:MAG: alpha/beta hydrolase [Candidatus Roizmanbacteria bacterium]|nr:alpha/beta hydrolase [Candidatus Roizmanbacteria bacterium]